MERPLNKQPIILDTDPGVDDALAMMLALGSSELDVIGICTVSGNVPLNTGTRNAQGLLQLLDRTEIPVFAGADQPLKRDPVFATEVHGESGMGQAVLPEPSQKIKGDAVDFLVQTLSDQPGEITIIAVGPLTNLALAEQRQPGTLQKAKQVIVMGGAIAETGNSTPVAEFNFYADPHAAQIVVHSDAALLIVPLDATRQVVLSETDIENQIASLKTVASQFVVDAVQNVFALYRQLEREPIVYLHDPLAVGAAIASELLRSETLYIDIETSGDLTMGQVVTDRRGLPPPYRLGEPVNCAMHVNAEAFLSLFLTRIFKSANRRIDE
ncbi:MAG: nucleoside hydrolase [Gemmatimonadetes bacterium]|nr:nucleoside hydrolase [Gemmatimonadota bacterium]MYB57708.1 nucleoside hydrolase [Gemmatimonadota bacterium]